MAGYGILRLLRLLIHQNLYVHLKLGLFPIVYLTDRLEFSVFATSIKPFQHIIVDPPIAHLY